MLRPLLFERPTFQPLSRRFRCGGHLKVRIKCLTAECATLAEARTESTYQAVRITQVHGRPHPGETALLCMPVDPKPGGAETGRIELLRHPHGLVEPERRQLTVRLLIEIGQCLRRPRIRGQNPCLNCSERPSQYTAQ